MVADSAGTEEVHEAASCGSDPRRRRIVPPDGSAPGIKEYPRLRPAASRLLRISSAVDRAAVTPGNNRAAAWGIPLSARFQSFDGGR